MRNLIFAGLLAAATLVGFPDVSHAQVFVRAPFVTVQVDRGGVRVGAPGVGVQVPTQGGVYVGAPAVRVQVPPTVPSQGPTGVIVSQPTPAVSAVLVPISPVPASTVVTPMTVEQFVASFQPKPGKYEVVLIHPKTCCPVKVCFELPCGCPCQVRWTRHVLEFDYPKCSVRVRFYHSGDVRVIS